MSDDGTLPAAPPDGEAGGQGDDCPDCGGTGRVGDEWCVTCSGTGEAPAT